jgi:hypothetical protein
MGASGSYPPEESDEGVRLTDGTDRGCNASSHISVQALAKICGKLQNSIVMSSSSNIPKGQHW